MMMKPSFRIKRLAKEDNWEEEVEVVEVQVEEQPEEQLRERSQEERSEGELTENQLLGRLSKEDLLITELQLLEELLGEQLEEQPLEDQPLQEQPLEEPWLERKLSWKEDQRMFEPIMEEVEHMSIFTHHPIWDWVHISDWKQALTTEDVALMVIITASVLVNQAIDTLIGTLQCMVSVV